MSSLRIPPLLRCGIRIHTETIDLLFQTHESEKRFACIVSAKVEKLAVGRNRTKRLVFHALSVLIPLMSHGVNGVIIVRRKLPDVQAEVTRQLRHILEMAHVISV